MSYAKEPREMLIVVHRAGDMGQQSVPRLTIKAEDTPPNVADQSFTVEAAHQMWERDGKALSDAIFECLPGGTIDQLICELMKRRASLFAVRFTF